MIVYRLGFSRHCTGHVSHTPFSKSHHMTYNRIGLLYALAMMHRSYGKDYYAEHNMSMPNFVIGTTFKLG
jgi:hypothetical protein